MEKMHVKFRKLLDNVSAVLLSPGTQEYHLLAASIPSAPWKAEEAGDALCLSWSAPPIPRSALEKDPRPEPLFEGNPVGDTGIEEQRRH